MDKAFFDTWTPRALGLLRIVVGYLYISHGISKYFGWPSSGHIVELMTIAGLAGLLELVGGALMIVGLLTRPVAFILSGEMAFAYFMSHATRGHALIPMLNGGELAVVYCFVFLFFAAAGAGEWSVDAMRRRSK